MLRFVVLALINLQCFLNPTSGDELDLTTTAIAPEGFSCLACNGMSLDPPDEAVSAPLEALGISVGNSTCAPVHQECPVPLCGRTTVVLNLIPSMGTQTVKAILVTRGCYQGYYNIVAGGQCADFTELPLDIQTAITQEMKNLELLGLATTVLSGEFCACDTNLCNGDNIDKMAAELQSNTAGVVQPAATISILILCFSVLIKQWLL